MTRDRNLVVANWKMHASRRFVREFAASWATHDVPGPVDIVICPPTGYLAHTVACGIAGVQFGVQNVAVEPSGAFTGEHAAEMAADLGSRFAIVGHSERRRLFAETNAVVGEKLRAAQRAGLVPILCVGETLSERDAGRESDVVMAQLEAGLSRSKPALDVVVAYEPVWAIGTGKIATPALAQVMHGRIRARLVELGYGVAVRLLYGGSVNGDNASDLFAEPDIDGALVGGASLDAGAFARICRAAAIAPSRSS